METEKNPDVEELRRYNREGCTHDRVPGALNRAESEAAVREHGPLTLSRFDSSWCGQCGWSVLVRRPTS